MTIIEETLARPIVNVVSAPTHEEIAARAHLIYERRGGDHGHDIDDWLQAEAELLNERTAARAEN